MAESFPGGSELLEAMTPEFDGGDYLAPEGPGFATRLTEANKGRAYYADLENLGKFVMVDFVKNRRKQV